MHLYALLTMFWNNLNLTDYNTYKIIQTFLDLMNVDITPISNAELALLFFICYPQIHYPF